MRREHIITEGSTTVVEFSSEGRAVVHQNLLDCAEPGTTWLGESDSETSRSHSHACSERRGWRYYGEWFCLCAGRRGEGSRSLGTLGSVR